MRRDARLILGSALLILAAGRIHAGPGPLRSFSLVVESGSTSVSQPGFGHGWRYAGGFFVRTAGHAGIEVLLERYGVPIESGTAGLAAGRMNTTTLVIDQCWFPLVRGRFVPYALVGIGFTFIGYAPIEPLGAGDPRRDFVDRLALQLGGGLDYRVSGTVSICGKLRCNLVKTWVEELPRTVPVREVRPEDQNMLHLYGLELGLGLKVAL